MKGLWIAFIIVATLGSLYPFDFGMPANPGRALAEFLQSCCRPPGRGDLVGNVLLFLPFGFFGVLAVPSPGIRQRTAGLLVLGVLFALVLQILQVFLPSRDENLQDVVWNTAGTLAGMVFGVYVRRLAPPTESAGVGLAIVPLALAGTWLTYRLIPFVPSLDWQLVKDSLRPLLTTRIQAGPLFQDAVGWLLFFHLLGIARPDPGLRRWLPPVVAAVFALEILIVENSVDLSDIGGAALALLAWFGIRGHLAGRDAVLAGLAVAVLLVMSLVPFSIQASPASFEWLPFHGFLHGSMSINAQAAAYKIFFFGSLLFLLKRLAIPTVAGAVAIAVFALSLEIAQLYLGGHTPEITDPLLVVFIAIALVILERDSRFAAGSAANIPASRNGGMPGNVDEWRRQEQRWTRVRFNVRQNDVDFLEKLATELPGTTSRITRLIVERFLADCGYGRAPIEHWMPTALDRLGQVPDRSGHAVSSGWAVAAVNLTRSQGDSIRQLADAGGLSRSAVLRRIVRRFAADAAKESPD